jgi:tetratricopeptide (TPR) repeat protein
MIATGSVLGPEVLAGVPADLAFTVWQVLRALQLWTSQPDRQREGLFDPEYMADWEGALLTGSLEPDVRFPLAVIVGELAARPAGEGRLSWACVCVADWALGHRAVAAALAFAEAAALASPTQARYAWLAGRLLRTHGEGRQAERWLRRAYRVAVSQKDGETQARSLTALGNLALRRGSYPAARAFHTRALRISRRWRLREQEGMANHDLFTLSLRENNRPDAERFARGALDAYRAAPDRIPRLAHDVAYWWMEHGYYARALRTFEAVRSHTPGEDHLRVLANIARSHAGLGDHQRYTVCVANLRALIEGLEPNQIPASALLELVNGAVALEDWVLAEQLIQQTCDVARVRGEADDLLAAEALAGAVARRNRVSAPALAGSRGSNGEQLANDLVELLTAESALAA